MNIFDDADKLNAFAFPLEPGAAFISDAGRKESPVGGDDIIGEKAEALRYLHQDVKDLIVKVFSQARLEVGEGGFTGYVLAGDPGVKTKMFSPFPVPERLHEGFHVGILFEMAEEIQKKKAHRIVGDSDQAVVMGDDGMDKGEVYQ